MTSDGGISVTGISNSDRCAHIRRKRAEDAAVGIDAHGEPIVGVAKEPAAIFHGADTRHVEMLFRGGGAAEPSVVRNIDQQVRAPGGEVANLSREDGFVTNEAPKGVAAGKMRDGILAALAEASHFIGEAGHHAMNQREGLVFAKWAQIRVPTQ